MLKFYDLRHPKAEHGTHVSAITGLMGEDIILGLLQNFLRKQKAYTTRLLSHKCVPGTRSGSRLDAWLLAEKEGQRKLFQIEIKNWCASSIGGIPVPLDKSSQEIHQIAKRNFERYFQNENNAKKILKVLSSMRLPQGYEHVPNTPIIPLVALWAPVAASKSKVATSKPPPHYFVMENKGFNKAIFPEFHVFSTSLYLRSLAEDSIDIKMPRFQERLDHIRKIVDINPNSKRM